MGTSPLLEIRDIEALHGDLQVLWGVSLTVMKNDIAALLGTNGAGKSTLLRCITGLHTPSSGTILFKGQDITAMPAHHRVVTGIVHVLEERGIFPDLSVIDNIRVGAYTVKDKDRLKKSFEWIYDLFPILKERRKQRAGSLSGGEQQQLSIAKGLISRPELLILDEPSLGLAPVIVFKLFDVIRRIQEEGVTILLVDQNLKRSLGISTHGHIMENGRIVLEGSAGELLQDPRTQKAFIGR
jgi:branched-chain amino acid transport system ATP-binding protein